ncbi:hypothetical protein AX14_013037 [Amanita brunnescens Koide BX004]|nr:hypothetical protein AX14_013037 [Amanita brunnescens Koide BX004]
MPPCPDCSLDFLRLDSGQSCQKCSLLVGKSDVEKAVIRAKGQCMACSVVFTNLIEPLCNTCCNHYHELEEIPAVLLRLNGAADQLGQFQKSSASDLLRLAFTHQKQASDHRLGLPRPQNTSLQKATLAGLKQQQAPKGPSTARTQMISEQIRAAKDNKNKIKITAGLYTVTHDSAKFSKVLKVYFSQRFTDSYPIYDALGEIIEEAREHHRKAFPLSPLITRPIVTIYAHESPQKAMCIPDGLTTSGSVLDFFLHFVKQGWIPPSAVEKRSVEIRLVCNAHDLDNGGSGNISESPLPSRPRPSSKRKLSTALQQGSCESAVRNVRASAWPTSRRPDAHIRSSSSLPSPHSRPCVTKPCDFIRLKGTNHGNYVTFERSDAKETICVAHDWCDGKQRATAGESYHHTGYIGKGTTKLGIYARFQGQEYVITQCLPGFTDSENKIMLEAEYENLLIGETLHSAFDELAREKNQPLPFFQFNLKNALFGEFVDKEQQELLHLEYRHFIATQLLPCGPIDAIVKYTGNANEGDAPRPGETMLATLHAFAHFTYIYTHGSFLLCDLQGTYNKSGIMCLIDPQSHSSEENPVKRIYWDKGPHGLREYMEHHRRSCSQNPVCMGMELATLSYVPTIAGKASTSGISKQSPDARSHRTSKGILRIGFEHQPFPESD